MSEQQEKVKGKKYGLCNRTACQSPKDIVWYFSGTNAYYCPKCARLINDGCRTLGFALCTKEN